MDLDLLLIAIIGGLSIIFGFVIINRPKILPYIVGGYFIISGIMWILRAVV
ncbi:hypothetical protein ACFLYB_06075 [Chloroflexota bacterium]